MDSFHYCCFPMSPFTFQNQRAVIYTAMVRESDATYLSVLEPLRTQCLIVQRKARPPGTYAGTSIILGKGSQFASSCSWLWNLHPEDLKVYVCKVCYRNCSALPTSLVQTTPKLHTKTWPPAKSIYLLLLYLCCPFLPMGWQETHAKPALSLSAWRNNRGLMTSVLHSSLETVTFLKPIGVSNFWDSQFAKRLC